MTDRVYLAVDLGASSGRVLAGLFDGGQIRLEEVHRFGNGGISAAGHLYWDLLRLWADTQEGLRLAGERYGAQTVSVGVDTWGVDFGLLGRGDQLLSNPFCYRDPHTAGVMERVFERVSRSEIFATSGLQFMPFNTLYQLYALRLADSPLLDAAESFLMIPDLFHWLLSGEKVNEYTNATTTQFLDARGRCWATSLLEQLELPTGMFGPLGQPGDRLGKLRGEVAAATGLSGVEVVLPGTHDTASAVMAVPAAGELSPRPDWCYISSGTWSLMGVEVSQPVLGARCEQLNFTNEGGVGGSVRLLKNIAGLWLVQECRRCWSLQGQEYDWDELVRLAEASSPLATWFNPDDPRLTAPADMPQAIGQVCASLGQPIPDGPGATIRAALESLALRYRLVLDWLEQLTGGPIRTVHIVGGGSQNRLLNQLTADACNRPVVAGPVEATALGNLAVQAMAAGDVGSIAEVRQLIAASFPVEEFTPQNAAAWDQPFAAFKQALAAD